MEYNWSGFKIGPNWHGSFPSQTGSPVLLLLFYLTTCLLMYCKTLSIYSYYFYFSYIAYRKLTLSYDYLDTYVSISYAFVKLLNMLFYF